MAGPIGHFRAGKGSRMVVVGTNLRLKKYTTDFKTDDLETDNFEAGLVGAFDQGTVGFFYLDYSGDGDWDAQQNALDAPPGIYPRDDLGLVKLYASVSDNTFWNIGQSRVLSSKVGSDSKGLVSFGFSAKSNSSFTAPTGSV